MTIISTVKDVTLLFALCLLFYLCLLGPWVIYVGLFGAFMAEGDAWSREAIPHHCIIIGFGVVLTALWCWAGRKVVGSIWEELTS